MIFEFYYLITLLLGLIYFVIISNKIVKNYHLACYFGILLLFNGFLINSYESGITPQLFFEGSIIFDTLAKYGKSLICFISILCFLINSIFVKKTDGSFEYIFIHLFAIYGMCLLVGAYDFILIYLAIELQSLNLYILATSRPKSVYSVEAGIKYFILGSLASGILVFGLALLYLATGMHTLGDFSTYMSSYTPIPLEEDDLLKYPPLFVFVGIGLFLCGLLFKLGAAPFHTWVADVYEGAPLHITMFFASVPKIAILFFLVRFCGIILADCIYVWSSIIAVSSLFSLLFGSLGGMHQFKLKRLFAFSSINHVGYMLIGLLTFSQLGLSGLILYLIVYVLGVLGLWILLMSFEQSSVSNKFVPKSIQYITDLIELGKIHRFIAILFVIFLFSMGGIPPFGGFYIKAYLFFGALDAKLNALIFFAILSSMISIFYYLRLVKIIYFKPKDMKQSKLLYMPQMRTEMAWILSFILVFLVFFIFASETLLYFCQELMSF